MRKPFLEIGSMLGVEFEPEVLNSDGSVAWRGGRQKNLLLDSGLDKLATSSLASCINYAAVGSGTNPTYRDSGTVTASQAGNAVTLSAGFLAAGDTGRLLKYDSGQEVYLTYLTPTTATASGGAQTIAASQFTIWYVSDTGLQTELKRSNLYASGTTDNQSTFAAPATWTHKQTFLFSAEVATVTYNEIGWSDVASAGANLFGRATFISPPSLGIGQQLKVTLYLSEVVSPSVQTAIVDVGNNGYNTSGVAMIEFCGAGSNDGISGINNPNGGANNGGTGNPRLETGSTAKVLSILRANFTQATAISSTTGVAVGSTYQSNTNTKTPAYVAKSFYLDWVFAFNLSTGNGADHYGLTLGQSYRSFSIKFTTPQTKDASHTLSFTFRFSWGRVLVN